MKLLRAIDGSEIENLMESIREFDKPKYELWDSFSDGGELQWIQDLDLLNAMSFAYYSIKSIGLPSEIKLASDAINSALEIMDRES
ncbi:MAG: hypothetical protein U0V48_04140 [Anaerolineales bacterium]